MNFRPRRPRPDANQKTILAEINQVPGFGAWDNSASSDEKCPGDIVVLYKPEKRWGVFEVKTRSGRVSREQLEMSHFVPIVRCTEDILRWFGRI